MQAATIISHGSGNCHAVAMIWAKTTVTRRATRGSAACCAWDWRQPPPQNGQERGEGRHDRPSAIGRPSLVERGGPTDSTHRSRVPCPVGETRQLPRSDRGRPAAGPGRPRPRRRPPGPDPSPTIMRMKCRSIRSPGEPSQTLATTQHEPGPGKTHQVKPRALFDLQRHAAIALRSAASRRTSRP